MKFFFLALAVAGFIVGAWIPNGNGSAAGKGSAAANSSLSVTSSEQEEEQPVELGTVIWLRDLDTAVANSKSEGKPIALLFQEVPGWQGCQDYGQQVLAQSLIVEALEDNFVPVAIYNNVEGKDKQILDKFKEPAWNYQVMRFLDSDQKDLIPRKDKVWDVNGTASRMATALKESGHEVPDYLNNVLIPETAKDNKIAVFAMYCFWTGEAKLGSLDGVIATESGFFDGHEVVVVKYDQKEIKLLDLVGEAEKFECADAVYLSNEAEQKEIASETRLKNVKLFSFKNGYRRAPDSDQKRQLMKNKKLSELGLTPMQWTKLNSSIVTGDKFEKWLSPRQLAELKK